MTAWTGANSSEIHTRLIRLPEVQHLTGLGRSQLYALALAGKFPAPLKLSERCSAWQESSVRAWIAERVAQHVARAVA
jgi:prophage regulatory protein